MTAARARTTATMTLRTFMPRPPARARLRWFAFAVPSVVGERDVPTRFVVRDLGYRLRRIPAQYAVDRLGGHATGDHHRRLLPAARVLRADADCQFGRDRDIGVVARQCPHPLPHIPKQPLQREGWDASERSLRARNGQQLLAPPTRGQRLLRGVALRSGAKRDGLVGHGRSPTLAGSGARNMQPEGIPE